MTIARYNTSDFGANPFSYDIASVSGTGSLVPQFKLGHVTWGDSEAEWVYAKLTLASTTNLLPGQLYVTDDDYNLTLLTTSGASRGQVVYVSSVFAPALAAGTYYLWVARSGQIPVAYTTLTTNNLTETTATGGAANSPSSPTVGSKLIVGLYFTKSPATFTGTVTNGSPYITGPFTFTGSAADSGPFVGQTITGTGIPASTIIGAISFVAGQVTQITMMTAAGVLVNGTATNTGVTITPSLLGEARLRWSYIDKTN